MNIVVDKDNFLEQMEYVFQVIKQGKTIEIIIDDELEFKKEDGNSEIFKLIEKSKNSTLEEHVSLNDKYDLGK